MARLLVSTPPLRTAACRRCSYCDPASWWVCWPCLPLFTTLSDLKGDKFIVRECWLHLSDGPNKLRPSEQPMNQGSTILQAIVQRVGISLSVRNRVAKMDYVHSRASANACQFGRLSLVLQALHSMQDVIRFDIAIDDTVGPRFISSIQISVILGYVLYVTELFSWWHTLHQKPAFGPHFSNAPPYKISFFLRFNPVVLSNDELSR